MIKHILLLSLATCINLDAKIYTRSHYGYNKNNIKFQTNTFLKYFQWQTNLNAVYQDISMNSLRDTAITGSFDILPFLYRTDHANALMYNNLQYIDPWLSMLHLRLIGVYQNSNMMFGACGGLHEYISMYYLRSIYDNQSNLGFIVGFKDIVSLQLDVSERRYDTSYISNVQSVQFLLKLWFDNVFFIYTSTTRTFGNNIIFLINTPKKDCYGLKTYIKVYDNLFLTGDIICSINASEFTIANLQNETSIQFNISFGSKHPLDHMSIISKSILNNVVLSEYNKNIHNEMKVFKADEKKQRQIINDWAIYIMKNIMKLDNKITLEMFKSKLKTIYFSLHTDKAQEWKEYISLNNNISNPELSKIQNYLYTDKYLQPINDIKNIYMIDPKHKALFELMYLVNITEINVRQLNNEINLSNEKDIKLTYIQQRIKEEIKTRVSESMDITPDIAKFLENPNTSSSHPVDIIQIASAEKQQSLQELEKQKSLQDLCDLFKALYNGKDTENQDIKSISQVLFWIVRYKQNELVDEYMKLVMPEYNNSQIQQIIEFMKQFAIIDDFKDKLLLTNWKDYNKTKTFDALLIHNRKMTTDKHIQFITDLQTISKNEENLQELYDQFTEKTTSQSRQSETQKTSDNIIPGGLGWHGESTNDQSTALDTAPTASQQVSEWAEWMTNKIGQAGKAVLQLIFN